MGNCSLVHLPRWIWGIFLPGGRLVSHSAPEKMPFSAWNRLGAPSAQDLGCFPARQAVGISFCAGKDTFFCPEPPRSTFCAGFGVFSCSAGGWYPIPRRKRCIFLPGAASEHLSRRIGGVFLLGRRWVSYSGQEKIHFSARSRLGAPSAQDLGCFSAQNASEAPSAREMDHFSARNASG